ASFATAEQEEAPPRYPTHRPRAERGLIHGLSVHRARIEQRVTWPGRKIGGKPEADRRGIGIEDHQESRLAGIVVAELAADRLPFRRSPVILSNLPPFRREPINIAEPSTGVDAAVEEVVPPEDCIG